jgi:superfamily II DNA helicase RecQ
MSEKLNKYGLATAYYHAGMPKHERATVQDQWMHNTILIIIATISFGMGVDKSNVRFVIHYTFSKSIENYY